MQIVDLEKNVINYAVNMNGFYVRENTFVFNH